jgi:hypothetical protein
MSELEEVEQIAPQERTDTEGVQKQAQRDFSCAV